MGRFTLFSLLLIGLSSTPLLAAPLPHTAAVPGGVVAVDLGPSDTPTPVVHFGKKRVMVLPNNGRWQALVGIPLNTKPGNHQLQLVNRTVVFKVSPKNYPEQHLTIKNKRKVNPTKEDMQRIRGERERINAALRHWQARPTVETRFILPLQGRLSSPFGLRRFFNGQPRKPHSGIDIAAPEGTPIRAPAAGTVIERGDFFFNGNSLFIDHGQGLVSLYAHMQRIDVQPGQHVKRGEIIGAVGHTGRATGPHLHWGVSLNDARVDPSLFFDDLAALLAAPSRH